MEILYQQSFDGVDISSQATLASVEVLESIVLITKITVTSVSGAGGNYASQLYLDDVLIIPDRAIPADAGVTSFCLESRHITAIAGETLKITLRGLAGDTGVTVALAIVDVTPVQASDVTEIGEQIIAAVIEAIGEHDFVIRPTVQVLGPCSQKVVVSPAIVGARTVADPLLPL